MRYTSYILALTLLSACPFEGNKEVPNNLGEKSVRKIRNMSWATGVRSPSDFNEYINGDSGILRSPSGNCENDPIVAPQGRRCTPRDDEEWETVILDGKPVFVPSYVNVEEFLKACYSSSVHVVDAGGEEVSPEDRVQVEGFDDYSYSPEVDNLVRIMRQNARTCFPINRHKRDCTVPPPSSDKAAGEPTNVCYHYVKRGLREAGLIPDHYSDLSAKNAGPHLEQRGFRNLLDDPKYANMTPYNAPRGAVIVYEGGAHGHIEVKAGDSEFISDYVGGAPIYDHLKLNRTPIGIYVK